MGMPMEFSFSGAVVRVVLVEGEPWWVAADVAQALEYTEASKMTRNLDDDEKGLHNVATLGGAQEMLVINESGLFSAILCSRKPAAKRFKKWVTAEVLPSLRRHGTYTLPAAFAEDYAARVPMASHVAADEIVSAGRVFRALYTTGRAMGMARRLAATRANQAAGRATGVDLVAELGAAQWLDGPDLPEPQRRQYELQQRIREHLVANNWPEGFSAQQVIEALALLNDRSTQTSVGIALQLLGYRRVRLSSVGRPYAYVLPVRPAA